MVGSEQKILGYSQSFLLFVYPFPLNMRMNSYNPAGQDLGVKVNCVLKEETNELSTVLEAVKSSARAAAAWGGGGRFEG